MNRRALIAAFGGAAASRVVWPLAGLLAPAAIDPAWAQAYPARPVRWIVGFAASGGNDIVARLMAQWLSERLGKPFVVENRPGGGGNVAAESVVRAPSDGYTLLLASASNAINATLYDKLSFDFVREIAPVGGIIRVPGVLLAHPSLAPATLKELIAQAKANPGKINVASGGTGTSTHMASELLKMLTGADLTHVPYRGTAPAISDLIGGQVQVMFASAPSSIEYVRSGRLRALAVTGAARLAALPDVPAIGELVPGYEASQWYGVGAPRHTPDDIVDKLNAGINAALADPTMQARLAELGGATLAGSPADFGQLIAAETEKWAKVVRFSGARAASAPD
jgi:tripartite-type tricarboxylate transporter receptor subunit TctC